MAQNFKKKSIMLNYIHIVRDEDEPFFISVWKHLSNKRVLKPRADDDS